MFDEIIGQELVKFEVFEPWCMGRDTQLEGTPVFGALALYMQDAVLTLASQLRFSNRASRPLDGYELCVSVIPMDAWIIKRNGWIVHSASTGARAVPWYAVPMHRHFQAAFLPLNPGRRFTGISIHPQGLDAVSLYFDGKTSPVIFEYREEFDGGIAWIGPKIKAPEVIAPFLPTGEFSWLHPASQIEIQHPLGKLRSATFKDWPLSLRRSVLSQRATIYAETLRTGAHLLERSELRSIYLQAVADLMQLRFTQHPALARRLVAFTARIDPVSDYREMLDEYAPSWRLEQGFSV